MRSDKRIVCVPNRSLLEILRLISFKILFTYQIVEYRPCSHFITPLKNTSGFYIADHEIQKPELFRFVVHLQDTDDLCFTRLIHRDLFADDVLIGTDLCAFPRRTVDVAVCGKGIVDRLRDNDLVQAFGQLPVQSIAIQSKVFLVAKIAGDPLIERSGALRNACFAIILLLWNLQIISLKIPLRYK